MMHFVTLCARGRVCTEVENESVVLASPAEPRAHLGQKTLLTMRLRDIKAEHCLEDYFENKIVCDYNLHYLKCNGSVTICNYFIIAM